MSYTVYLRPTLLYMLVLLRRTIDGLFSCSIPHTYYRRRENLHYNHRAEVSAGEDIPSVLLRSPQGILEDWVVTCTPEKSRSRPHNPRIELVVQRSCAQHANRICRENSRQDKSWCHSCRDLCLLRFRWRVEDRADDFWEGLPRRLQPASRSKQNK